MKYSNLGSSASELKEWWQVRILLFSGNLTSKDHAFLSPIKSTNHSFCLVNPKSKHCKLAIGRERKSPTMHLHCGWVIAKYISSASNNSCFLNKKPQGSISSRSTKAHWLQEHDVTKKEPSCHPLLLHQRNHVPTTGTTHAGSPAVTQQKDTAFRCSKWHFPHDLMCECQGRPSRRRNIGQEGCKRL